MWKARKTWTPAVVVAAVLQAATEPRSMSRITASGGRRPGLPPVHAPLLRKESYYRTVHNRRDAMSALFRFVSTVFMGQGLWCSGNIYVLTVMCTLEVCVVILNFALRHSVLRIS